MGYFLYCIVSLWYINTDPINTECYVVLGVSEAVMLHLFTSKILIFTYSHS